MGFVRSCQLRHVQDGTVLSHVVAVERSFVMPLVVHLDSIDDRRKNKRRVLRSRRRAPHRMDHYYDNSYIATIAVFYLAPRPPLFRTSAPVP